MTPERHCEKSKGAPGVQNPAWEKERKKKKKQRSINSHHNHT